MSKRSEQFTPIHEGVPVDRAWWEVDMEDEQDGEPMTVKVYAATLQEAFAFAQAEHPNHIAVEAMRLP